MIIRLKEKIKSVCGKYEAFKGEPMDVIKYDERLEIYHCKTRFTKDDSIVYEVCKESAEVVQEQKPEQEKQRPFKIKIIKILPGMDHSGINLGDELYPITWEKDRYGVEVDSYRWRIPKGAAEVIETMPVEQDPPSKYHRLNTIKDKEFVDFYDIINLLQSNGDPIPPEIQHALKKLMYNDRGHKNMIQDKKEAVWSINRWLENNEL